MNWAIDRGDGDAWLYYIFAICQWLPTGHRINYGDKSGYDRDKCKLCLLDETEDMYHMLRCPALLREHMQIQKAAHETLVKWQLPFSRKGIETCQSRTCRTWFHVARRTFVEHHGQDAKTSSLSSEQLWRLIRDYWNANNHKPTLSTNHFITSLGRVLTEGKCSYQQLTIKKDLLGILIRHFRL